LKERRREDFFITKKYILTMLLITFYLISFIAGMIIGFWAKGDFQEDFETKKEYNQHMFTMLSICLVGIAIMLKFHQYL
jgi:uncharacterized protein involved in cysteine biosynthesis